MADDKIGDALDREADNRAKGISAVNSAAVRKQMVAAKKAQTLEVTESYGTIKGANQAVTSIDRVLKNLGSATEAMATGVKLITAETARGIRHVGIGSARAMGEYAKAVGEDININKQAFLAITLGRISPILGYSVAKMMETTVFKNMIERMKEGIGKALSSVTTKFKMIASMGWEKAKEFGSSIRDFLSSKRGAIRVKKKIPQAQKGGFVKKGGLARVHAAELITPKSDLLGIRKLASSIKSGFVQMRERNRLLEERMSPDIQKNILIDAYKEATDRGVKPQALMVKYLIRIAEAVSKFTQWSAYMQSVFSRFPWYRIVRSVFSGLSSIVSSPFMFLFRRRGGIKLKGRTMFEDMGTLLGGIYDILYLELDRIVRNTNDTANLLVGIARAQGIKGAERSPDKNLRKYSTLAGNLLRVSQRLISGAGGLIGQGLERTVKSERGRGIVRSLTKQRFKKKTPRHLRFLEKESYELPSGMPNVMDKIYAASERTASYTKKANEQRRDMFFQDKRQVRATESTTKVMQRMSQRLKRARGNILKWVMMAGAFITTTIIPMVSSAIAAVGAFVSASVLPILIGLKPLLGPLAALAGGVAIGTLVNKYLIKPVMDKYYSEIDKRQKKSMTKSTGSVTKAFKTVSDYKAGRGGTAEDALKAQTGLQAAAGFAKIKGREKSFGRGVSKIGLPIIQAEQENFMFENIDEYLRFGSQQINQLREKWIQEGKTPKFRISQLVSASGYEDYGRKRESAFLEYLKSKGTIVEKAQLMKSAGLEQRVLSKASAKKIQNIQESIVDYSTIVASFTGSTVLGLSAGLATKYLTKNPTKLVKAATKILKFKQDEIDPEIWAASQAIIKQKDIILGITKEKLASIGATKDLFQSDLAGRMVEGMTKVKDAVVDTGARGSAIIATTVDNSVRAISTITGGGGANNQTGPGGISFYGDEINAMLLGNLL